MPRGRPKGSGVKQMPLQFDQAEEINELIAELMPKYHNHLIQKDIRTLFVNKALKKKGKTVIATAEKVSKKVAAISNGADFLIVVSYSLFQELSDKLKRYVVDHELCHCFCETDEQTGDEKNVLLPHDFEDFNILLEKYGLVRGELQIIADIIRKLDAKEENKIE